MRRLGELRWRAVAGEIEVEAQDQVNRSGRPRDPNLPDVHTLVCLEFIRNAAATIEALAENTSPPGLMRGRDRAWTANQDAAGRFILRQAPDGALLPKLEQQVNPLTIAHEQVLHAVSDVCFDLLAERGIAREQVVSFFQQLNTAARESGVAGDE